MIIVRIKALEQYFVCCFLVIFVRFPSVEALRLVRLQMMTAHLRLKEVNLKAFICFPRNFFKIQEIASQCSKLLDNFSGDFKETEETWTDQLNSLSRWKKMLH